MGGYRPDSTSILACRKLTNGQSLYLFASNEERPIRRKYVVRQFIEYEVIKNVESIRGVQLHSFFIVIHSKRKRGKMS